MNINNKTVLIYAAIGIKYPTDQYGISRNEGRIPTNIGFGLMELGYDVNIVSPNFKELIIEHSNPNGFVRLSQQPINSSYDFSLSWGATPYNIPVRKEVNYINYSHEIKGITKLASTFVTPYKQLSQYLTEESKRPVDYLPPLYPIPSYHLGFKEFNYKISRYPTYIPTTTPFKVFVYISSWERITFCIREFEIILNEIKYIIQNKYNLKLKLYIQIDSDDTKKEIKNIMRLGDEIEFIYKLDYDKYLNLIEDMDAFIIKGNQFMASAGMYDIISLGKPMLYVSESLHNGIFRNPLFENTKEIVFSGDNELSLRRQAKELIENPKRRYDIFRESLKDSDFNNWEEFALKMFSL